MPPLEVLDEWFVEEPAGVLRWRKDYLCWNTTKRAGEIAGKANREGRFVVSILGDAYLRSRLIYKMHARQEPQGVVDHLNRDPLDDRFENLQDITNGGNLRNSRSLDDDFFVVDTCTDSDGRTYKTVRLTWQCLPDENADAIAARLNVLTGNYLNNLNTKRVRRTPAPRPTGVDEGRLETLLGYVRSAPEEPIIDEQEDRAKVIRIRQ
jgi:hypothetical protein